MGSDENPTTDDTMEADGDPADGFDSEEFDSDGSKDGSSGCPFHETPGRPHGSTGESDGRGPPGQRLIDRAVDRRSFVRTALAIGGTGALAAVSGCSAWGGDQGGTELGLLDLPRGPSDSDAFPERQHAWRRDLRTDPFGNVVLPTHQLILFLNYTGSGTPRDSERGEVEACLRTLERSVPRLTGGDPDAPNEGLVCMVGYSGRYFDRFDESLPSSVGLQSPEAVLRKTGDAVEKADAVDAVVLLSSDTVPVLLAAEAALFGELDTLNGVDIGGTLSGIFETVDRRTGFVGRGLPREKLDDGNIHEDAPLSMGYKSGFADNQATEASVTITEGPFEDGTTFQVSKLRIDLGKWYGNDRETRDELMFTHRHSRHDIGDIGEGLGDHSATTEDIVENLDETAKRRGRVGHAAKTARGRTDDFEPRILRRSEGVNNAFHRDGTVAFNFSAVMETIEDFVEVRKAMNGSDLDDAVEEGGHGILPFIEVTNRATFLLPPRRHRSLPPAVPGSR